MAIESGSAPSALFQGYSSITSAGRSTAVGGTSTSDGARSDLVYTMCRSASEVLQSLNISGSVSATFGFGTLSAKAKFVHDQKLTNNSLTIAVYCNRISQAQRITDVHFVKKPSGSALDFYRQYGDSYVSGLDLGGEYISLYTFFARNESEKTDIEAKLGLKKAGKFDGEIETKIRNVMESSSVKVEMRQTLTGYNKLKLPKEKDIADFALGLSGEMPDSPVVIRYETASYENVPDVIAGFDKVRATLKLFENPRQGLAAAFAKLNLSKAGAEQMRAIWREYYSNPNSDLETRIAQLDVDIRTLAEQFDAMDHDPTKTFAAPALASLSYGSPAIRATQNKKKVGGYRPNRGSPFDDVPSDAVAAATAVKSVTISGGAWVDSISVTYKANGVERTATHGGSGGGKSETLNLGPGERIISVSTTSGHLINQITVMTNQKNELIWPPNPEKTDHIDTWSEAVDGGIFLGFSGRCGEYLDELSVVFARPSEITWVAG